MFACSLYQEICLELFTGTTANTTRNATSSDENYCVSLRKQVQKLYKKKYRKCTLTGWVTPDEFSAPALVYLAWWMGRGHVDDFGSTNFFSIYTVRTETVGYGFFNSMFLLTKVRKVANQIHLKFCRWSYRNIRARSLWENREEGNCSQALQYLIRYYISGSLGHVKRWSTGGRERHGHAYLGW